MKKNNIFKMFVFTIMLFLIGVFNVKADFTIDFSNSDNREIASNELFTSKYKTHYRVTTNGDVVYCYQPYVDYAYEGGTSVKFVFTSCSNVSTNAAQLAYVYTNGYGGNNDYSTGGTKFDDYYATQLAVWYFGDRTLYSPNTVDFLNNFNVSNGRLTGNYNGSSNKTSEMAAKLINDANDSVNATSSISLDTSSTKLNINSDRSYYVSGAITISGSWIRNAVSVSISGVTGAFVTSNVNATGGSTDFKVGDTIYVKVPAGNITKSSSITLSATGTSSKGSGTVQKCTNSAIPAAQKMTSIVKGTPSEVNKSLTLTVEPSKVEVKISKQDIDVEQFEIMKKLYQARNIKRFNSLEYIANLMVEFHQNDLAFFDLLKSVDELTIDDVLEARKYFSTNAMSSFTIYPSKK